MAGLINYIIKPLIELRKLSLAVKLRFGESNLYTKAVLLTSASFVIF